MGFAWNGVCYQDGASAVNAFVRDMTAGDAAGINSFTAMPTFNNSTGQVSWSISNRPLSTTTATTRTGTTTLLTCTDNVAQYDVSSLLYVAALFFAAIVGFRSSFSA